MSKRVLPVSPDIYEKVAEIAEVSNKSLRQATDDLLKIAFEGVCVGAVTRVDTEARHKVIFTRGTITFGPDRVEEILRGKLTISAKDALNNVPFGCLLTPRLLTSGI
jgi:hypothetical protein